jgi:hypothetical protein
MDTIAKGMNKAARQGSGTGRLPAAKAENSGTAVPNAATSPDQAGGTLDEVKNAMHDVEEQKGDWSKDR